MGNTQTGEKRSLKSPATKNFIRNLNRKSQGRASKKKPARDKADSDREDNSECVWATVHSQVTVQRSPTPQSRDPPNREEIAGSVHPDPPSPAAGLQQRSSDSRDDFTLSMTMPLEKEESVDVCDRKDVNLDEVMGAIFSKRALDSDECSHEFGDNRLKACPGTTAFTLSKHRKVELPPMGEPMLDTELVDEPTCISDGPLDSNVLRKVASLTLDKVSECRTTRPKFVPEKLDFQLYEKFEEPMFTE